MSHTHPRGQSFTWHLSYPYMKSAILLLKHTHTQSRGKGDLLVSGPDEGQVGTYAALTLGLVPRQAKSWSGASSRRMR